MTWLWVMSGGNVVAVVGCAWAVVWVVGVDVCCGRVVVWVVSVRDVAAGAGVGCGWEVSGCGWEVFS